MFHWKQSHGKGWRRENAVTSIRTWVTAATTQGPNHETIALLRWQVRKISKCYTESNPTEKIKEEKLPWPGFEPGLLRPQRRVPTTRRSRLLRWHVRKVSRCYTKSNPSVKFKEEKLPWPGIEPGLLRPQRRVQTTRRSRLLRWQVRKMSRCYTKSNPR